MAMTEYRRFVELCQCGLKVERWYEIGTTDDEPWRHVDGQISTVPCSNPDPVKVDA